MDYMEYDEDLIGEAPCEFCGDLYPLILLIEHQSTHYGDDAFFDDFVHHEEIQNTITESVQPKIVFEQKQTSIQNEPEVVLKARQTSPVKEVKKAATDDLPVKNETKIVENVQTEQKSSSTKEEEKPAKKPLISKMKEFTTESGEKLFVYGSDIDPEKDVESEKQTYKIPNNPLLNSTLKEEDVEDINNLSDDDCSETLEEFWKRARDHLKRNRIKS